MSYSRNPCSFEDFLRWLAQPRSTAVPDSAPPSSEVLAAATLAWRETQSLRSVPPQTPRPLFEHVWFREDLELMAAAATENGGHPLPRLRTPNGFVISALYATHNTAGNAPIALLVECPVDSIQLFKGLHVQVLAGDRWVEIGEIDADGKATGDLPEGVDFKPPFALRVGAHDLDPEELRGLEGPG